MCGISGILNLSNQKILNLDKKLNKLNSLLIHRGPDNQDIWVSDKARVGLAHTRLSIIDLQKRSNQPMISSRGNVISYNGEIYNYKSLKKRLEVNYKFKTNSDTEVILAGYEINGLGFFKELNGMFAFALWDEKKKKLFCVRDRFGIKPLYYSVIENNFFFSSEVKALLPFIKKIDVDNNALLEYLIYQFSVSSKTLFQNVNQINPGEYLEIDDKIIKKKYWDITNDVNYDISSTGCKKDIYKLLYESIKMQQVSDVEVSTYNSGGLDSGLVSILSKKINKKLNKAFHGNFVNNEKLSELKYADEIAEKNNLELKVKKIDYDEISENLSDVIFSLDYPVGGPGAIPQFILSKYVSSHVKVILGGQGGDEIFGGYVRYLILNLETKLKEAIFNNNENSINNLINLLPSLSNLKEYLPMLSSLWSEGLFDKEDLRYFSLIDRSKTIRNLFDFRPKDYQNKRDEFQVLFNQNKNNSSLSIMNKMMNFDLRYFLPALLQVEDRVSMNFSLESRVPFLDNNLFNFLSTIPNNIKFLGNTPKYIYKEAFKKDLPDNILHRKDKMGFPVPLRKLLTEKKKYILQDIISGMIEKKRPFMNTKELKKFNVNNVDDRGLWALVSLELWYRNFFDHNDNKGRIKYQENADQL